MTDIREELARAIKRAGTGKPNIGLSSDGPWREWDLSLADAVLPIIDRLTAAARAEAREKVAAHFDGLRMLRQMWTAEQAAAAIRALGRPQK